MFFKDVIGHEEIKQRLITSLQTGRISHAQLFSGDTGAGSLALALAFTQYLFCTGDKHEDACGVCRWQRENEKQKTPGQFHRDQWFLQGWKGTHIYRYQIYFGNR